MTFSVPVGQLTGAVRGRPGNGASCHAVTVPSPRSGRLPRAADIHRRRLTRCGEPTFRPNPCVTYRDSIDYDRNSMEGRRWES